ncbi:MAG: transposase [Gaiellaceae bacterium]
MPRPLRLQVAGGLFHVTAHSNVGRLVFQDNIERMQFLAVLDEGVARCSWLVRAYCLLSTHYHLLVATPELDLSSGMQYLNGRFAQWANWHRGERSHVFEGRFKSVLVETEGHALEAHRYIALNPVRAGLVRDPADWRWSSVRAILGLEPPPALLDVSTVLDEFGANKATARRRLRAFLRDGLAEDMP